MVDGGMYPMINSRIKFQFESISCSLNHLNIRFGITNEVYTRACKISSKYQTFQQQKRFKLECMVFTCVAHSLVFLVSVHNGRYDYKFRKALFMHSHFTATKCFKLLENLEWTFFIGCSLKFSYNKSAMVNDFHVSTIKKIHISTSVFHIKSHQ